MGSVIVERPTSKGAWLITLGAMVLLWSSEQLADINQRAIELHQRSGKPLRVARLRLIRRESGKTLIIVLPISLVLIIIGLILLH